MSKNDESTELKVGFSLGVRKSNIPFSSTDTEPPKQSNDDSNETNTIKQDGEEK